MAYESATERRGVLHAGRWASRALIVLGGAAAGTAAAWAISGTSASADTIVPTGGAAGITTVTDATGAGLHQLSPEAAKVIHTAGVSSAWGAADQQDATSWSIPSSGPEQLGVVTHPVQGTLGVVEHVAAQPQDTGEVINDSLTSSPEAQDFGGNFWDVLNPEGHAGLIQLSGLSSKPVVGSEIADPGVAHLDATEAPASAGSPASDEAQLTSGAEGAAATVKNISRRDHGDGPAPFAPAGSPLAPLSVPTGPGGGSAPGGHFDGPAFGVPAWSPALLDNAKAGSVRPGVRHMPLTPGAEPGTIPD